MRACGLRVLGTHVEKKQHTFDHWMHVAGSKPGDRPYVEARRLLEASMADDSAAFHPRFAPESRSGEERELIFDNTSLFIAAERI